MASGCIFCAIIEGREAGSMVLREPGLCAFLDSRPVFKGHVLIVPEAHTADLAALEDVAPLFALVRRVALAVPRALGAQGAFVAVNDRVSQSVPHLHAHVVPRSKGDGLRGFFWPRTRYDSLEERDAFARRIADALAAP
jgi:histidine triad (HIT) family protein